MSIYREIILEHFKKPRNFCKLKGNVRSASSVNPLCGDKITMQVEIKNGRVEKIGFTGEGCAISIASASLLTEYSKKKKILQLQKFDKSVILKLLGIELSLNRLKCALLPLETMQKAISRKDRTGKKK